MGDADEAQFELGWEMLATLMRSRLATSDDSEFVQVIAEHEAISGAWRAARPVDERVRRLAESALGEYDPALEEPPQR